MRASAPDGLDSGRPVSSLPAFLAPLAGLLLVSMLVAPTAFSPFKLALLASLLAGLAAAKMFGPPITLVHPSLAWLAGFYILLGSAFMFLGAANGGQGALAVGTTYALWPAVFTLLCGLLRSEKLARRATQVFWLSSMLVVLYILMFSLSATGYVPTSWVPNIYPETQMGFAVGEGYVEVSVRQLSSLLFLGPYFLAMYIAWPRQTRPPIAKPLMLLVLGACAVVSAFGGRRALLVALLAGLLLTMLLLPFLPTAIRRNSRRNTVKLITLGAVLLALTIWSFSRYLGFETSAYIDFLSTGLDFDYDSSAIARRLQFFALLDGWAQNPILGHGHGTAVPGYLRSLTQPWSYELSYMALLFHTGLLGLLCYAAGIVWILCRGLAIIRQGAVMSAHMIAALVGMLSFLVGNATNPYLEKFDFMFVLFYPAALINLHLLSRVVSTTRAAAPSNPSSLP